MNQHNWKTAISIMHTDWLSVIMKRNFQIPAEITEILRITERTLYNGKSKDIVFV